jgi:hypothetical protein
VEAAPAARFSPQYVPPAQGSGRFDIEGRPVWYLSESPVHAVCEMLQPFRSRPFLPGMLRRFEQPLALVEVDLLDEASARLVDLDDPAELLRLGLTPGTLASENRKRTQAAAVRVYASGATGMRWWSKLNGDWHGVVLFLDRVPIESLEIDTPEILTPEHPVVVSACRFLGMTAAR